MKVYRNCKYYSNYRLTQEVYPNLPSTAYQALAPIFKQLTMNALHIYCFIINTPFGCIITFI